MRAVAVTVLMDLPAGHRYHRATLAALRHASAVRGIPIEVRVVPTDTIRDASQIASSGSAVIIGPGSPYRDPDAAHAVIREARERNIPLVGTWGDFQHVLVEHARSLAGIANATHAEYGPGGTPVITLLACSLQDQTIKLELAHGSLLAHLYGSQQVSERTTCSYGLAPEVQHIAGEHGMRVAATDATGEVRGIERVDHPFFIGTLYQPQLRSAPGSAHPVFLGLLDAALAVWCAKDRRWPRGHRRYALGN